LIFRLLVILITPLLVGSLCGQSAAITPTPGPPTAPIDRRVANNPMVHQDGRQIVTPDGQPLRLRGVNLGGWLHWEGGDFGKGALLSESAMLARLQEIAGVPETANFQDQLRAEFITEADIARIAELGFNSVRLPINGSLLSDEKTAFAIRPDAWQWIDQALTWCEKHKVYVILDLHAVPGGQSRLSPSDPGGPEQIVWKSAEARRRTVELWRAIAARYHERRIIAAYDLINEPLPPKGSDLVDLYRELIPAIRAVDPNHMLIIEGGKFSSDFTMFSGPLSYNQVYGFHMYTWFGDNRAKLLAGLVDVSARHNVPLWAGEFGENTAPMIASTVEMYENPANEISGWSFWTWKKVPARWPTLGEIQPGPRWTALFAWINSKKKATEFDRQAALGGMADFVQAARLENLQIDTQMLQALLPRASQ
jgi:hypothetical protein